MTAAAALLSSFVRAVLTWRHRTVTSTRQAGRRHFFGGIATNCLNNSKSAPLSPSSAPLRTALSSPPIALLILAFGKKAVLPWRPISASRFWLSRQRFYRSLHIPRSVKMLFCANIRGRWGVFTDGSRWNTSPAPLIRLLHSLLAFSVLNKLKTRQIFTPFFATLHAVPVSFMVPKFSLKFATQSSEFECFGKMHLEHILP